MNGMRIRGIGAYAPPDAISNEDIAVMLQAEMERELERRARIGFPPLSAQEVKAFRTTDRWGRMNIGFSSRRFVNKGEGTIDLAFRASKLLLSGLAVDPSEIDAIIFATVTPSYLNSPPDANLLQDLLGIPKEVFIVDTSLACSSWVASLTLAYSLISSGLRKNVLLIGADAMSTTINWRDRAFACVFGDAGTATLCSATDIHEDWFGLDRFYSYSEIGRAHV